MEIVNKHIFLLCKQKASTQHTTLLFSAEHPQLFVGFQDTGMGSWFLYSDSGGCLLPDPWKEPDEWLSLVQPICSPKLFWLRGDHNNPMKHHCTSNKKINFNPCKWQIIHSQLAGINHGQQAGFIHCANTLFPKTRRCELKEIPNTQGKLCLCSVWYYQAW